MRFKKLVFVSLFILLITLSLSVSAQRGTEGGNTRPQPSNGGNAGGPGMNGAAYSPSVPDLQVPAGQGGGGGRTRPAPPPDGGRGTIPEGRLGGLRGGSFTLPTDLSERFQGRGGVGNFDISQFFAFDSSSFSELGLTPPFDGQDAQAAYNQVWDDYYAAVETTADTYYTTVTASTDYALQTYEQALTATTEAVDDYAANASEYAAYCAAYPWDCYSYVYDAASDTYTDTSSASADPAGTVTIAPPAAESLAISAPEPSAEAYQALVTFANDQLGLTVAPLYAGAATADITAVMGYLPAEIQAYLSAAAGMAESTYWGIWTGGAGAVMVGSCSADAACTVNSDTLSLELTSASAGGYTLLVNTPAPTTPDAALNLLTTVYPKLTGLTFAQVSNIQTGMAFTATAASLGYDPDTGAPLSVAKVIYVGVVDVNGQSLTYALVGIGEAYAGLFGKQHKISPQITILRHKPCA